MAFIDSLLARLRPQGVTRVIYASDIARGIDGKSLSDIYKEQPHLQTVIDFMAQNVAQLPLKCYVRHDDADRERDTDGVLPLLLANPNPDMTEFELIYSSVVEWAVYGRSIWLVGRDKNSASGWQIRPIPCAWVTGWGGNNGFAHETIKFQDPDSASGVIEVPTDSCVIFSRYMPGHPASALSPVESLRQTLSEQVEAQAFRRAVWSNATRISGYISRPQGVEWSDGGADRFKKDMRANWGRGGAHEGGTPVLEDGMEFHTIDFNSREKDWASGVKLSREDCAAAYHINPSIIWPGDGQTYASAKDNARALYADTLAPLLTMFQRRINKTLAPMIGAPELEYAEFDINAKLMGSFEEQAAALQSAVGGPWMTREEARALRNLPKEPQGELITPLNVLVGGLASPTDTAPKSGSQYVLDPLKGTKTPLADSGTCNCPACVPLKESRPTKSGVVLRKSAPVVSDERVGHFEQTLKAFFERQSKVVLSKMGAKGAFVATKDGDTPVWWDAERWTRELADDLAWDFETCYDEGAKQVIEQLGLDASLWDEARTQNFLYSLARTRANLINGETLKELEKAIEALTAEDRKKLALDVFDRAGNERAEEQAKVLANTASNFGSLEAAQQCGKGNMKKTWVHNQSKNPRPSHQLMAGETVSVGERFSNGAKCPGDASALPAAEVAYCHCTLEYEVEIGDDGPNTPSVADERIPKSPLTSADLSGWVNNNKRESHAKKHAATYGIDYRSRDGQEQYTELAESIVDTYEYVVYDDTMAGQRPAMCAFYIKDDDIVVVNIETKHIVTLFRYERGHEYYDEIWDKAHG